MSSRRIIEIQPQSRGLFKPLADLWAHAGLLRFLVWRDWKVRYRQSLAGVGWAVIQPVVLMAIFSVFLAGIVEIPGDAIPYWLFSFMGLVVWTLFAQSLNQSSNSLVNQPDLVKKAAFPRLVLPVAAVGAYLVDFAMGTVVAIAMIGLTTNQLSASMLLAPVIGLLAVLVSLSIGVGLSALNVKYRDVRYGTPFIIQALLFAAPVVYPVSLAPERVRGLLWLNPMTGVVELYRWTLLGSGFPAWPGLVTMLVVTLVCLVLSLLYFSRSQAFFADVI